MGNFFVSKVHLKCYTCFRYYMVYACVHFPATLSYFPVSYADSGQNNKGNDDHCESPALRLHKQLNCSGGLRNLQGEDSSQQP